MTSRPHQSTTTLDDSGSSDDSGRSRRRDILKMLAGAGGVAGVALAVTPEVAAAAVSTDAVEIDLPGSDSGKMTLRDFGTQYTGVSPGTTSNNFRLLRADGAGYISNNASFVGSASGGSWTQDNSLGMTVVEEFGEGNWGIFLAPSGSSSPIGGGLGTVLNAEFTGGTTGNPVVQVPIDRLFVGKPQGSVPTSSVDASLRVIAKSSSIRPFFVQGNSSVLAQFTASTAGSKALALLTGGPDENNASYLAVGVDPSGGQIGYASGGAFVSAGKNGTGATQNLILHVYEAKDVVVAPGNAETARFPAGGGLKLTKSSTAPAGASNAAVLYSRTNGSGKSELVARFGTGSPIVIATEP